VEFTDFYNCGRYPEGAGNAASEGEQKCRSEESSRNKPRLPAAQVQSGPMPEATTELST